MGKVNFITMNDTTTQLIESLAQKLGTTAEYLWGVLIKQAYVDATINLILGIGCITYLVLFYVWYRKASKKPQPFDDLYNEADFGFLLGGGIASLFALTFAVLLLREAAIGYLTPEYWALEHILHKL